ncbi:MAG: hypoxanthine phosphoribosyltransferase [Chloroflexota bacterium]
MTPYYPPEAYQDLNEGVQEVLFSAETIEQRVRQLGQAISRDYEGCNPLLVGVLKGVFPFMSDLLRMITIPVEVDFMAITRYTGAEKTKGAVRITKDLDASLEGRHVLFVEDVIDTGLTLNYLMRSLHVRGPASLKVCTLFNKSRRRLIDIPLQYKGFDLPAKFVVGYGLDYREKYRNLPFVGLLSPAVFQPVE